MAIPTLYVGACVDWTFTFVDVDNEPVDLEAVDEVQIRFRRGQLLQTETPDLSSEIGEATLHTDVDFLSVAGAWQVQGWTRIDDHWTPSSELVRFVVLRGIPDAAA